MIETWTWTRGVGTDIDPIVQLAQSNYEQEVTPFFTIDPLIFGRNVALDIVKQFYNPLDGLVCVARDNATNDLMAYTWAERNRSSFWSNDEMVNVNMAHVDLNQSARVRVRLVEQMIDLWELWAYSTGIKIICSSTVRDDQQAFLKLHTRKGYTVRGSIAYKRLI